MEDNLIFVKVDDDLIIYVHMSVRPFYLAIAFPVTLGQPPEHNWHNPLNITKFVFGQLP